ncbi:hypothetical protein B296_00027839 [Ensete ventricosum]|uniref:WRKY domain-containing protein n=1 Tax=Ensete ventricosum TaxID=4639 RepID=A0A426YLB8_ENSVE|nr:hypothetical protein B296_00027839 [Ensete ventricosum]
MRMEETEINWLDSTAGELMRELLEEEEDDDDDDETCPTFVSHESSIVNKLISTVYSGPTIRDVESALSTTLRAGDSGCRCSRNRKPDVFPMSNEGHPPDAIISCRVSVPEKSSGKMDSKYTLRMKICGNGVADDGYKWRKYGQKSIKNSPNPSSSPMTCFQHRSYYRCTNPRCNAKKQVERSLEDPEMLIVTYEGLHLHYTSHFLLPRPQDLFTAACHAAKKPKLQSTDLHAEVPDCVPLEPTAHSPSVMLMQQPQAEAGRLVEGLDQSKDTTDDGLRHGLNEDVMQRSQGLLEDIVPLLVRKPCNSTIYSYGNNLLSHESPPSSSTISWSPSSPYLDVGIFSSIL